MVTLLVFTIFIGAVLLIATLTSKLFNSKDKIKRLQQIIDDWDDIKKKDDKTIENYRRLVQEYARVCISNYGHNGNWNILDIEDGYVVVKHDPKGYGLTVIAKSYFYNPGDENGRIYALHCAEELLEKLNEEV